MNKYAYTNQTIFTDQKKSVSHDPQLSDYLSKKEDIFFDKQ